MKILGHYREMWPESAGTPQGSINDFVADEPEPDAERIHHYLASAAQIISIMSHNYDVFNREAFIMNSMSVYTDGVWVWRNDLRYYFRNYHVRLPAEFLARVRELNYEVPLVSKELSLEFREEVTKILR